MQRKLLRISVAILAACFLIISCAIAQSNSSDITGRVLDPKGQAVVDADVLLTNDATGEIRATKTTNAGEFVFATVQPGTYSLNVKAAGFKEREQKGLSVSSSSRYAAGDLKLEMGAVKETVTVEANATPVQTNSGERSALLDSTQVTNLMSRGRDIMALLTILPGVIQDDEGGEALGTFNSPAAMSGTRGDYNGMNIDGISGNPRSGSHLDTPLNMDAISEVKVLQNSYQAEFGKGAGSIVNIVSKGGGRTFHGAAYDYLRNEAFNARNWFDFEQRVCPNNATTCDPSTKILPNQNRYRYETFGYNLGGPIYIPGHFNTNREKAFFFFSQELLQNTQPNGLRKFTVPTALERNGDFTQTFNGSKNGVAQPLFLADPLLIAAGKKCSAATGTNSQGCFPNPGGTGTGGVIPANRIDPNFQNVLKMYPMPMFDSTFQALNGYNYQVLDTQDRPVRQEIARIDYNFSNNLKMFVRGMNLHTHNNGVTATTNKNTWSPDTADYTITGPNVGGTITWIINPTMVNEFTLGWAEWREHYIQPAKSLNDLLRSTVGFNYGMLFSTGQFTSATNPLGILPFISYGVSNSPNVSYDNRYPLNDNAYTWTYSDGISKLWGNHQFKAGIQTERATYWQLHTGTSGFPGNFNFSGGANNSNNGFANSLLGNFNSYSEATKNVNYAPVTRILEWYVQDTWKAMPRLTLDLGVRFTAGLPQIPRQHMAATFNQSLYNPATAPQLFSDVLITAANSNGCNLTGTGVGKRAALNPFTGLVCDKTGTIFPTTAVFPTTLIGQFVPPGYGPNPDGMVISGVNGYPNGLVDFEGVFVAPRFGFAYDVFGDGKTALRGGFGVNYNPRQGSGILGDLDSNPPLVDNFQQFDGSTWSGNGNNPVFNGAFLNSTIGKFQSPANISRLLLRNSTQPVVYNASLGIQREIGFGTVVDIGYVGSFGRHLGQLSDLNQVPYGARFGFIDPANPGTTSKPNFISDNFLRYFSGYGSYGNMPILTFTGNASYHSLQTQITHRLSHGMQFGGVWTWSKAMDYNDQGTGSGGEGPGSAGDKSNIVRNAGSPKIYNYGLAAYDRTHVVAINYMVDLPKASRLWDNFFVRTMLDNWQVAGITRFSSGMPLYWDNGGGNASDNFMGSGQLQFPSGTNTDLTGGGDGWRPQIIGNVHLNSGDRTYFHYFNPNAFTLPDVVDCSTAPPGTNAVLPGTAFCHFAHGFFGNTGPNVLGRGPGLDNFNLSLFKNFKVGERWNIQFRAEAYNVFNHAQFSAVNTTPKFAPDGTLANGLVLGADGNPTTTDWFGRVTKARDPRILQFALRITF